MTALSEAVAARDAAAQAAHRALADVNVAVNNESLESDPAVPPDVLRAVEVVRAALVPLSALGCASEQLPVAARALCDRVSRDTTDANAHWQIRRQDIGTKLQQAAHAVAQAQASKATHASLAKARETLNRLLKQHRVRLKESVFFPHESMPNSSAPSSSSSLCCPRL